MSKQANTAVIGGFVVGAVVLVVAGILIFGSGRFFSRTETFVLFFDGSIKGLNIGAPVDFKGVKIGSVTDIKLLLERKDQSLKIPVYIKIDPDSVSEIYESPEARKISEKNKARTFIEFLVEQGLKAQLRMQSLVTGQLYVYFDFYPDKPVRRIGADPRYIELPTIPSSMQEISKTIETLPLNEIADKLVKSIEGIEKFISSPELKEALTSVGEIMKRVETLMTNIDSQVKPLSSAITKAATEAQGFLRNADKQIGPLSTNIEDTLKATQAAVTRAEKALVNIESATGENSEIRYEFSNTLKELTTAARSVRVLTDYLERHPEALIKGKSGNGGK